MIKVGIAEDDFRVAQIHEQFLQTIKDVQVIGKALNAAETFEMLETHTIDLLLLDIYLPDSLGVDLLHQIREKHSSIDIIMLTAATEKAMVEKSLQYGVINYIIKPVTLEKFVEAIESYKQKKKLLEIEETVDQKLIDQLFNASIKQNKDLSTTLPKGIDTLTLEKVETIISNEIQGVSAEYMGEKMGASRTTARRYLEYLTKVGQVKAEVEYGIVGRPERKYYKV